MLDTDIVIHARDEMESVLAKFLEHQGAILISSLTFAELQKGFFKRSEHTASRRSRLMALLPNIQILSFDRAAAEAYGQIIAQCGWAKGRDFDRMIAAHAISINAILVTNNAADFRDIPALQIENWAT
jgi:tRNA(fMet)-specific endonuclease VapC